jgi:uncharacterized DUF497 family protein
MVQGHATESPNALQKQKARRQPKFQREATLAHHNPNHQVIFTHSDRKNSLEVLVLRDSTAKERGMFETFRVVYSRLPYQCHHLVHLILASC